MGEQIEVDLLIKALSEGFDKLSGDLDKLGKSVEAPQEPAKKTALSLTDLKSGIDLAKEAASTFAGVFKTAFEMGKEGATIIQTAESLTRLASEAGYAGDLIGDLETAAGGTVDDIRYMGSALKTLTSTSGELQANLAQNLPAFLNISRAVVKLNPTLGDTADVFDAITRALQTGQTRGLKPYGFQIDATASAIDQMNQIMEQGAAMVNKLGGNVESAVDPFNRLENSVDNLKDNLMTGLTPALTNAAEAANIIITAYDTTTAALAAHSQELINAGVSQEEYTAEMKRAIEASALVLGGLGMITESEKLLEGETYALAVAQAAENQELSANIQYAGELSQALTTQLIPSQSDAADAADKVAEAHQREATAFAEAHTNSTLLDGAIDDLAASYNPANTAASLLKDTIGLLTDTQAEANRLMLEWAIQQKLAEINTGDLTEAEKRQLSAELELMLNQQTQMENLETLNQLLADGTITREQARQALADHNLTTSEMNELMGVENETIANNTEALFLQEEQIRKGVDAEQALIDKNPALIQELEDLAIAAENAAGDYEIRFNITQIGTVPNIPSQGGAGSSGPGSGSSGGGSTGNTGGGTTGIGSPIFDPLMIDPTSPTKGATKTRGGLGDNPYLNDPRFQTMVALGMNPNTALNLLREADGLKGGGLGETSGFPMPSGGKPPIDTGGLPMPSGGGGTAMPPLGSGLVQNFILNLYSMATTENVTASFAALKAQAGVV